MKTIIAGGRDFNNYEYFKAALKFLFQNTMPTEIVSGGANGADKMGERYAAEKGIPLKVFPADWNAHGKAAGPIRNEQMALYADALVAFWDGSSKGTKSMIDLARKNGLKVRVVHYPVNFVERK
jgi:hypothetical protein